MFGVHSNEAFGIVHLVLYVAGNDMWAPTPPPGLGRIHKGGGSGLTVVRCKYFETCVHIKNTIKNSYQDGVGRTTQALDHVVVLHILIWDKRKSQINEYSDKTEGEEEDTYNQTR